MDLIMDKNFAEFCSLYLPRKDSTSMLQAGHLSDFDAIKYLASGKYGNVFLVRHKDTGSELALKILSKKHLAEKDLDHHAFNEKELLTSADFPFIVHLYFTFQDNSHLYFGLEYASEGDVHDFILKYRLSENAIKFYMAQIFMALKYLHSRNFIYRDLKPENILVFSDGYWKLCDFGSTTLQTMPRTGRVGTAVYMAPEVLDDSVHTVAMDWWQFGVMLYLLSTDCMPFEANEESMPFTKTFELISAGHFHPLPEIVSDELEDLIRSLLIVNVKQRYGEDQVKHHPWFSSVRWFDILTKKAQVPTIKLRKQKRQSKEPQSQVDQSANVQFPVPGEENLYGNRFEWF